MKASCFFFMLMFCSSAFLFSQQFEPIQPADISSSLEEAYLVSKRREMVQALKDQDNFDAPELLNAFVTVPRHLFVPENLKKISYRMSYLPLGGGQVLPDPGLLAAVLSSLRITPTDRVLVAGASTPYTAALISTLASEVFIIEGIAEQYESGLKQFKVLGLDNIFIKQGITFGGWREETPFNCILIHGAIERIPAMVLGMLAPGGRLVCSLADPSGFQMLLVVEKRDDQISIRSGGQSFFPFLDFL